MSTSPVNVGDVLADKYEVERVLGMGGMGVVVAAKHRTLGERVAIKFLLPEAMARADVVARFLREGQAAARLRSEHITRVHDVGKLETGAPFLVMEYLDGQDLAALVRERGPLAPPVAVDFVLQACEALAEAHSAGVIHRDLKPSNLFVIARLDGSPSIKLIDFGISKVIAPGAEGAEGEMTATAVMMGSPLYMAPEQMASARDVDVRADIWSLGVILHTVLTGAPPFRAPTVMGVYELIVQGAPPIRQQRADVPEGLEAAILRCLRKERHERFDDVGQLAEALAPFGSPDARAAAERIKRILVARKSLPSAPLPAEMPVPVASVTPAPSKPAAPKPAEVTPSPSAGSSPGSAITADPHATDGPWDQRTRPPASRRRTGALLAVVLGVVLIAVPIAFFVLRGPSNPSAAPAAAPPPPVATATAAPPATAHPSVAPAEPTPTASASASAAPSAPPTVTARAPRAVAPPPHKPAKPRSVEDLFGTQK